MEAHICGFLEGGGGGGGGLAARMCGLSHSIVCQGFFFLSLSFAILDEREQQTGPRENPAKA